MRAKPSVTALAAASGASSESFASVVSRPSPASVPALAPPPPGPQNLEGGGADLEDLAEAAPAVDQGQHRVEHRLREGGVDGLLAHDVQLRVAGARLARLGLVVVVLDRDAGLEPARADADRRADEDRQP